MNNCSICKNYEPVTAKMVGQKVAKENHDVVQVVRCKDCEWYREGNHFLAPTKFCYRLKDSDGKNMAYNMSEMGYCSYGRRKKDEE